MAFAASASDQFALDILQGIHQVGDNYKIALYTQATATDKNETATTYNTTGELPTAGGYTQGGISLTGYAAGKVGDTAYIQWSDAVWSGASFSADAAVIYNATRSNKILAVVGYSLTTATAGTFTLQMPTGTSSVVTARVA